MAARVEFTIYQGDNFERRYQLRDRDPATGDETLIDITDWTFEGDIRPSFTKRVVASFDVTKFTSDSRIVIRLDSFVTAALLPGDHVFDLEVFENGDRSRTRKLMAGVIRVLPESTRRTP